MIRGWQQRLERLQPADRELLTAASLVGVDRYLGAMAGLLLRTAVVRPGTDVEQMESIRGRTDTIIFEQAADPLLSPVTIAAQLNISLRQLYRAFSGTESPAARIRRRRLEHAAELLARRAAPSQVERIAQECGFVSAEYFSRAFRREFGLSPQAWLSASRLRWAKHQLRVSQASISDIALAAGYSEQSALTRALRRECGQTPAAWRRATPNAAEANRQ